MSIEPFLVFADGPEGKIYRMSPDGTGIKQLPLGDQANPVAITYNPLENMLYWCDIDEYTIKKAYLNGTGVTTIIQLTRGEPFPSMTFILNQQIPKQHR